MKKSVTVATLTSANKRKQVLEGGPFQRTEAMLFDPQAVSVQPESEAMSHSSRPQRKKNKANPQTHQTLQEESKNFLKSNIGDFKMKILGAMHTTNQAIQNAGKKQESQDQHPVPQGPNNQYIDFIQKDTSKTSGRDHSPSAMQVHKKEQSLVLVPEASFPVANSEV